MVIAVLDYITNSVIVREASKEYIDTMYDGDVEHYVCKEVLVHHDMDNVYVMSNVEHLDIDLPFKS